jgi:hypothetical protein
MKGFGEAAIPVPYSLHITPNQHLHTTKSFTAY